MNRAEKIPEPWFSFLAALDAAATEQVRMDCLGGFVITLVYGFSRPTGDLDVLEIAPRNIGLRLLELGMRGGPLHEKYNIYLERVGMARVPEDYADRMTEICPGEFEHLRLFALDPYDLAVSKLERNIQRDRDDVRHLARTIPFDLKVLQARYRNELRWQLGNPERRTSHCSCGLMLSKKRGRRLELPPQVSLRLPIVVDLLLRYAEFGQEILMRSWLVVLRPVACFGERFFILGL